MRVLVTGVKGQLGYDVMNELKKQGLTGIGVDVDEMDITDAEACRRVITVSLKIPAQTQSSTVPHILQ